MSEINVFDLMEADQILNQLCLVRSLKDTNADLEKSVDDLESLVTKMTAGDFCLDEIIENPLIRAMLDKHVEKLDKTEALKQLDTKKLRRSVTSQRKKVRAPGSKFQTPTRTSLSKLSSTSPNKRIYRTRRFCHSEGILVSNQFFFRCVVQDCPFEDYSETKMKTHYKDAHSLVLKDVPLPIYELQLQDDDKRRHGGRQTTCTHCRKIFHDTEELDFHVMKAHVPRSFKRHTCVTCDEKFVLLDDLKKHRIDCYVK